jgi:hypothetical protein
VVGIDLGTTNCAVCYVDTAEDPWCVRVFRVPQLVAPGVVEAHDTLPSFYYQAAPGEPAHMLRLPWSTDEPRHAVGRFARDHGALVPGRLISSAKSWLCHGGIDRTARVLPWHAADDVQPLSPVEASARYLEHIRDAWNHAFAPHALAEQDIVLTLPASFDEVARELTVAAARAAGLPRVVLIEEPQAAFYSWIYDHQHDWSQRVTPGQKILVCDVGGGTTDFTLIRVCQASDGTVQFHRVAVGEHLLLGGDNFDLALARYLEPRLAAAAGAPHNIPSPADQTLQLPPRQWLALVRTCRAVKETLLGPGAPPRATVHVPASGARLLAAGLQCEITRQEVHELIVEGFFPRVPLEARPRARQSGFQEFGLPYAPDAAITRYLAAFLTTHRDAGLELDGTQPDSSPAQGNQPAANQAVAGQAAADPARPDLVLFNGGVFSSPVLRQRMLDVLVDWFGGSGATGRDASWQPEVLENPLLYLAVARGAAYYGMVRRGCGVRIAASLARTYYVGVDDPQSPEPLAVCVVPAGLEPGDEVRLTQRSFELTLAEPVEFPLYVSSSRLTDAPGTLVACQREQLTPLAPIRTVLRAGKRRELGRVAVELHARLTEIGTLEMWCSEAGGRRAWQLQFDVRSATQTDVTSQTTTAEALGVLDSQAVDACLQPLRRTFGPQPQDPPAGLPKRMAAAVDLPPHEWPPTLLRTVWAELLQLEAARRRGPEHEARWLNLLGYALRPGFGMALDDWRVAETWRVLQGKLVHTAPQCRAEWWILWRRLAGGLTAGQQHSLAAPLLALVRQKYFASPGTKGRGADFASSTHEEAEIWRLLGALELLDRPARVELARAILDLLPRRKLLPLRPALWWTLGRIAARVPVYGPLNGVLPPDVVGPWLESLLRGDASEPLAALAVLQLARYTGDRYRDLPPTLRDAAARHLERIDAPAHYGHLVRHGGTLEHEEQRLIFGEALPRGLRIA